MNEEEAGRVTEQLRAILAEVGLDRVRPAPEDPDADAAAALDRQAELEALISEVQAALVDAPDLASKLLHTLGAREIRFELDRSATLFRETGDASVTTVLNQDALRGALALAEETQPILDRMLELVRG